MVSEGAPAEDLYPVVLSRTAVHSRAFSAAVGTDEDLEFRANILGSRQALWPRGVFRSSRWGAPGGARAERAVGQPDRRPPGRRQRWRTRRTGATPSMGDHKGGKGSPSEPASEAGHRALSADRPRSRGRGGGVLRSEERRV